MPIKVLQVVHGLPFGGAENHVVTLATSLDPECYQVGVCCLRDEGVQAGVLRGRGIAVFSAHMAMRYWPIGFWRLYRIIRDFDPDVVHTHLYDAGVWGRLAARLAGVPVIVATEHGMTLWKKRRHLLLQRFLNRFTDKIIAVSDDIRSRRMQAEGVPPGQIITIPNGVAIDRFDEKGCREQVRAQLGIESASPVIGTVARLVAAKRLDELLQAARVVAESIPQARFLIIGDGPLREELKSQAMQLGLLPEPVRFLGSRQDIPELLSATDVFVLCSEREGLPVSLLEAMAAYRPVIATSVGGIPQVIQDGFNGLLVPPHHPADLAKAIIQLIGDADARRSLAENGRHTAESRFSATAISGQIASLYEDLLVARGRLQARSAQTAA